MSIHKHSLPIRTLEDWRVHAGPKREMHWKDGRSAKESARCWLDVTSPAMPIEVEALLRTNADFGEVREWHAEPEARMSFDDYAGEPRNADLLVHAHDNHGEFLIAVEAKADEPFGDTVAQTIVAARTRKQNNPKSNGEARVLALLKDLLGVESEPSTGDSALRYQLLTATAGAIAAASGTVDRVILLIQEFRSSETLDRKHDANARALDEFLGRLSGREHLRVEAGHLYGPLLARKSSAEGPTAAFYIGKTSRDLRQP